MSGDVRNMASLTKMSEDWFDLSSYFEDQGLDNETQVYFLLSPIA